MVVPEIGEEMRGPVKEEGEDKGGWEEGGQVRGAEESTVLPFLNNGKVVKESAGERRQKSAEMVGSAAGQRQSLWMRRRMREGEKQVEKEEEKKEEEEEENHPKENKEGENEEEKAAETEVKCIGGVELEEKKTDFDSRKEKRVLESLTSSFRK